MAKRADFNATNPFAKMPHIQIQTNPPKPQYLRRGSITRAAPKAPSTPPKLPNGTNEKQLRQQMWRYENMYKQTKNQLEVLKMQSKAKEKELKAFKSQKHVIESNHSNIVLWQKKLSNLEMEKQNLIDKNGLFLQQKNQYLLQLADAQQRNDEFKIELDCKNAQLHKLESEMTNSSQNYTQQLSKKENKYQNLKKEYNALHEQYIEKRDINAAITEQLEVMASQFKQMKQEHTLTKHSSQKLRIEYDALKEEHKQLETQISQVKGDSTIAVQLAQKKDKNIIKDLRQTLKSETIKSQQYRAEYMQMKDELNDLREWRKTYLQQQTLQTNDETRSRSDSNEDIVDNISSTSSTSSKNSITIKNKLKILKTRSVTSLTQSLHDLLYEAPSPLYDTINGSKEHNEVIEALSNRLAIVKESYMNMKQLLSTKESDIEKLKCELAKNKEMIADLIEKVNDKPLPPTPRDIHDDQRVIRRLPRGPPPLPPPNIPPPKVVMSPSYNKGIQHDIILKKVYKTVLFSATNANGNDAHMDHDDDDVMLGDGI